MPLSWHRWLSVPAMVFFWATPFERLSEQTALVGKDTGRLPGQLGKSQCPWPLSTPSATPAPPRTLWMPSPNPATVTIMADRDPRDEEIPPRLHLIRRVLERQPAPCEDQRSSQPGVGPCEPVQVPEPRLPPFTAWTAPWHLYFSPLRRAGQ